MLEKIVMWAPQPRECRDRHDEARSGPSRLRVGPEEVQIVIDVLEDVHQQDYVGIPNWMDPLESDRFARLGLRSILGIPGIDTDRALGRSLAKQHPREEPGAGADIENLFGWLVRETQAQRARLARIVPVIVLIPAKELDFLKIHGEKE